MAVTYSVVGNVLTATAGATTVFTYTLDATSGNWAFKLLGQLDHPTSGTEDDLTINLGSLIQVTDKDGDKATLPATAVLVTVDDDMPVAVSGATSRGSSTRTLSAGNDDSAPGDCDPDLDLDADETTASGSVAGLFNEGADQPASYQLLTSTSGLPALTSGGVAVTYSVVGNVLTATAGATTVFTYTLDATSGNWAFNCSASSIIPRAGRRTI